MDMRATWLGNSTLIWGGLVLSAACTTSAGNVGGHGLSGGTDGIDEVGAEGANADGGGEEDDGPRFDVGGSDTSASASGGDGGVGSTSCKVDFLIVLDGSGSMAEERMALGAKIPGWLDTIRETVTEEGDFQVMVVDSMTERELGEYGIMDYFRGNSDTCDACENRECVADSGIWKSYCRNVNIGFDDGYDGCGLSPGDTVDCAPIVGVSGCDIADGAGHRFSTPNEDCSVPDGRRWLSSEDTDFESTLQCLARLRQEGERSSDAMAAALAPGNLEPGGCNEGFVRNDAILVVVLLTDERQQGFKPLQDTWNTVLDAKGGDPNGVVTVLYHNMATKDSDGFVNGYSWQDFVDLTGAVEGDVTDADYGVTLEAALGHIDLSCETYVPAG